MTYDKILIIIIIVNVSLIEYACSNIPDFCASQSFQTDVDSNLRYKFKNNYSWTSTAFNVIRFNWFGKFRADKKSRKICACALFKLYSHHYPQNNNGQFYNQIKSSLITSDGYTNLNFCTYFTPAEGDSFSMVHCVSGSLACAILKGYRKKAFFGDIFDIYVVQRNEFDGVNFVGVMKNMNLSSIPSGSDSNREIIMEPLENYDQHGA